MKKTNFDDKIKSLNQKDNSNKANYSLVENELKKLQTFYSIYFIGKSHIEDNGTQNYLVFQSMYIYFKRVSGVDSGNYIYFWKSKGLSDENITAPTTNDYSLNPQLSYLGTKTRAKFKKSCLKQNKITCDRGKIANIYNVYEISKNYDISSYLTLENCFFGAVSLTKNANIDNINILDMVLVLIVSIFSHPNGGIGRNIIIFGVFMSSSTKIDSRKKDVLNLGKGPTQRLEHALSAKKCIRLILLKIIKNSV